MRSALPLWRRGLVGRPAATVGLSVLVALTIAAAGAGPMLLRAVEQAAVRNAVTSAPPSAVSVVATDHTGPARPLSEAVSGVQDVTPVVDGLPGQRAGAQSGDTTVPRLRAQR